MKKALALTLAVVLCLALSVPAFAAGVEDWNDGTQGNYADGEVYPITPADRQGVVPEPTTDAHMNIIPQLDPEIKVPDYYYTVEPGDNLAAIAFAFYGDSSLSSALYKANENGHFLYTRGVLEAHRALRIPGVLNGVKRLDVVLTAPAYKNPYTPFYPVVTVNTRLAIGYDVSGNPATVAPIGLDGGNTQPVERQNQVIYIIKSGDTLKSIAKAWYGNDADPIIKAIKDYNYQLKSDVLAAGFYIILPIITIGY